MTPSMHALTTESELESCPLCAADDRTVHAAVHERTYFDCSECGLVFLSRAHRLDPAEERIRYETHENDPGDAGYRRFLARVADPLLDELPAGAVGLDYGSGPGPTLSVMFEEEGYDMAIYDPFFAPDPEPLRGTYDFITCTETAEHFFDPRGEFRRLDALVRPGGWLAVMTQLADGRDFASWRYVRDETHVCFYRRHTMQWIARRFGWSVRFPHRNVALFRV